MSAEANPGHTDPPAKASDGSRGASPGHLHVSALGVGGRAGSRAVVEAVLAEGLRVSRAAHDDAAAEEAEGRADPARVQRVAEAHDGGLAVGAHREPDGGHHAAHG